VNLNVANSNKTMLCQGDATTIKSWVGSPLRASKERGNGDHPSVET
jgi:hypothetical protein